MRKISLLKKSVLSLILFLGLTGNAQIKDGNLYFQINEDGESVTVLGHVDGQEATGTLSIPSSVNIDGTTYPVTSISHYAFMYCHKLTGPLVIPSSVTTIEGSAFLECWGFTSLDLGNGIQTISPAAFSRCKGFSGSLTIPTSVTTIGQGAFSECENLTGTVIIPSSVDSIGKGPFEYCYRLEGFIVEPGNNKYDSRDSCNAIIDSHTNKLVMGCKNTIFPETVTAIGQSGCMGVGLSGELQLPASITVIEDYAFRGNSWLTGNLVIPDAVTSIGSMAFQFCHGLDGTLTIGKSVEFIGNRAFQYCESITKIISLATVPPAIEYMLFSAYVPLQIPCETLEAYQNSDWNNISFPEIIEDCESVGECDDKQAWVYPNPTEGPVIINAEGIQSISIFNLLGAKVFESIVNADTFESDFEGHQAGTYLIRIETNKGIVTRTVLVK